MRIVLSKAEVKEAVKGYLARMADDSTEFLNILEEMDFFIIPEYSEIDSAVITDYSFELVE